MAGKYGSADVTISLENGPGGTAQAITNFVLEMGAVKLTANTEPSHAFGDTFEEHSPTGVKKLEPMTLSGFWDTSTGGPHVVMIAPDDGPNDDGRELVVVFGDSKTMTVDVRLTSYSVIGNNGNLTRFEAELLPTGTAAWS